MSIFKKNIGFFIVVLYSLSVIVAGFIVKELNDETYLKSTKNQLVAALNLATNETVIYRPYTSTDFTITIPDITNVFITLAKPVVFQENEFFIKGYSIDDKKTVETSLLRSLTNAGWVVKSEEGSIIITKIPSTENVYGILKVSKLENDDTYITTLDGVLIKVN
jgi:hypothetical protein